MPRFSIFAKVTPATLRTRGTVIVTWTAALLLATAGITGAATLPAAMPAVPPSVRIELRPVAGRRPDIPGRIAQSSETDAALQKLMLQHRCLAEALYYEAASEGEAGQQAIAEVIFHRLVSGKHGATVCGVVYEGANQTFCQFTFACDGSLRRPKDPESWRAAQVRAARLLAGELSARDETEGATSYHSVSVHPSWAPGMVRMAQIGNHVFYKLPERPSPVVIAAFRGPLQ